MKIVRGIPRIDFLCSAEFRYIAAKWPSNILGSYR